MQLSYLILAASAALTSATFYGSPDDYSGSKFLDMFTFDTQDDPTHGYVNYLDQASAQGTGLAVIDQGIVTLRADSTNVASGRGRNSVRVTSKAAYTHGLVILDLAHMPASVCGIWPAFWSTGPDWPNHGEIDIIEGVNVQSTNSMTLHTNAGCSINQHSCEGHDGCGLQTAGPNSYGSDFNAQRGGVYAMEWTSDAINMWFFPRGTDTANALSDSPDPSSWGKPTAGFQGGSDCSIDDHFKDHNLVFDTTFCGDWAGQVWGQDPICSAKAPTCQDFVRDNPAEYKDAFWAINSLKVFKPVSAPAAPVTPPAAPLQKEVHAALPATAGVPLKANNVAPPSPPAEVVKTAPAPAAPAPAAPAPKVDEVETGLLYQTDIGHVVQTKNNRRRHAHARLHRRAHPSSGPSLPKSEPLPSHARHLAGHQRSSLSRVYRHLGSVTH